MPQPRGSSVVLFTAFACVASMIALPVIVPRSDRTPVAESESVDSEQSDNPINIAFSELAVIDDQSSPRLDQFDRKRMSGIMFPPFRQKGNTGFILCADMAIADFGRNPDVHEMVPVQLGESTVDFTREKIRIEGRLLLNRPGDWESRGVGRILDAAVLSIGD